MKKKLLFVFFAINSLVLLAQNVGINTGNGGSTTPNASAILDLNSNNNFASPNGKGLLIPNVALTATNDGTTIGSPAPSLMVYNTGTGGLSPAGIYYNAGTAAAPNWVDMNKTHVVLGEALQPPTGLPGGGSQHGGAQTFGYGGFNIAAPWYSTTAMEYNVVSNPGEGAYYAATAQTIYNVSLTGWVLNDDADNFTTNVTMYLMKYSLGTAEVTNWTTTTLVGTSEGSQAITVNPGNDAADEYDVEHFSISATSIVMSQGDILICILQSNNTGTYLYYGQAQLEFDLYH